MDDTQCADPVATALLISIHGDDSAQLGLSLADLKALPAHAVDDITLTCLSGAERGRLRNYRGARLRDVINHIGLEAADRRQLKQMLVIARAHDGYAVMFSWNELFNTAVGDGVLVLYEKDGAPLDPAAGFALVSTGDFHTAPRQVKALRTIELHRVSALTPHV